MLKLRDKYGIQPLYMNDDDKLKVTVRSNRDGVEKEAVVTEVLNYSGVIDTIITANVIVNEKHVGIAVFAGDKLEPKTCGIE